MLRLRVCGLTLALLCSPLGAKQYATRRSVLTECTGLRNPCPILRTLIVGGSGYNLAVADPREDFQNNFVGDLVPTECGWVVVPPTCCPDGHAYSDPGWSVSSVWCTCNGRHMEWRCYCGAVLYAPSRAALPNPRPRPRSMFEDEDRGYLLIGRRNSPCGGPIGVRDSAVRMQKVAADRAERYRRNRQAVADPVVVRRRPHSRSKLRAGYVASHPLVPI